MQQKKPIVIGVTGGSASGKTSVSRAIFDHFSGHSLLLLAQDAYYKKSDMPFSERKKINYDHPLAFDTPLLKDHLNRLIHRQAVDQPRIKVARGFGDLSENSEYEAAKDEQSTLENRIVTIQTMLRYAEIIDSKAVAKNEVSLGKKVTFEEDGDEETYEIVGAAEADAFNGKISNESPIAQGLIGRKVGDKVTISTPGGEMKIKITKVEG